MPSLLEIMARLGIQSRNPGYEVLPNAAFNDVVQYTEWHAAGGFQRATSVDEYYRYDRYAAALNAGLDHDFSRRIAHIDIGCGAGLFSWAFLDWARAHEIEPRRLALYGYDHSNEMIKLAWVMYHRLRKVYTGYPKLRYYQNRNQFLRRLTEEHDANTAYIVTFGYVLAGSHTDDDINIFTQIIAHIISLNGSASDVVLASDATSNKHRASFVEGWTKLLHALHARGVGCAQMPLATGYTGDRCVLLSRREA